MFLSCILKMLFGTMSSYIFQISFYFHRVLTFAVNSVHMWRLSLVSFLYVSASCERLSSRLLFNKFELIWYLAQQCLQSVGECSSSQRRDALTLSGIQCVLTGDICSVDDGAFDATMYWRVGSVGVQLNERHRRLGRYHNKQSSIQVAHFPSSLSRS